MTYEGDKKALYKRLQTARCAMLTRVHEREVLKGRLAFIEKAIPQLDQQIERDVGTIHALEREYGELLKRAKPAKLADKLADMAREIKKLERALGKQRGGR